MTTFLISSEWAHFAKVISLILIIYRNMIWYKEVLKLPEPHDIDFELLGVTFKTSVRIFNIALIGKTGGAAVGVIGISILGYKLYLTELQVNKMVFQLDEKDKLLEGKDKLIEEKDKLIAKMVEDSFRNGKEIVTKKDS
jgi:hypothetical protein